MPILRQSIIDRQDLHLNRSVLYLFGDNLAGKGMGGQAKAMRGEPNAIGVPTKKRPSMEPGSFFSDADYDDVVPLISARLQRAVRHLQNGGVVIIPAAGLGTDRARLREMAPSIADFLDAEIAALAAINLKSM